MGLSACLSLGLTTRALNDAGQLLTENYSGTGTLVPLGVSASYDAYLRRQTVGSLINGGTLTSTTYLYDYASRLAYVGDGTYSANYAYVPNSSLVDTVTLKQGTTTWMTTGANLITWDASRV